MQSELYKRTKKAVAKHAETIVSAMPHISPKMHLAEGFPFLGLLEYFPMAQVQPRKEISVLIIDDDVDAALAIDSIFKRFGCYTTIALNSAEAMKKISSGKADIIILDWMLNDEIKADQIVRHSIRTIERFESLRDKLSVHRPKVITYSSLEQANIDFPPSRYFEYLDHWQKPIRYKEIANKTHDLLETLGS